MRMSVNVEISSFIIFLMLLLFAPLIGREYLELLPFGFFAARAGMHLAHSQVPNDHRGHEIDEKSCPNRLVSSKRGRRTSEERRGKLRNVAQKRQPAPPKRRGRNQ